MIFVYTCLQAREGDELIRDVAIEDIFSSRVCSRIYSNAHIAKNNLPPISDSFHIQFQNLSQDRVVIFHVRYCLMGWRGIRQYQERLFPRMVNMSGSQKNSSKFHFCHPEADKRMFANNIMFGGDRRRCDPFVYLRANSENKFRRRTVTKRCI